MRIRFLSSRQRAPETGAIAIIVSLLMVALLIFAAFAVDIGNAYANSRQLSVAADAAAIAAARAVGEVAPNGVSCADALAAIDEQQIAADAADELNTKNNRANEGDIII